MASSWQAGKANKKGGGLLQYAGECRRPEWLRKEISFTVKPDIGHPPAAEAEKMGRGGANKLRTQEF